MSDDKVESQGMVSTSAKQDVFRVAFLSLVSSIPVCGGPLSLILGELLPESRRARMIRFVEDMKATVQAMNTNVEAHTVLSDEVRFVVDEVFSAVAQASTDAKLGFYRDTLLNTLNNPGATSLDEKQIYLQLMSDLSPAHLRVLGTLYAHQDDGLVGDNNLVRGLLCDFSDDQLSFIVRDLDSRDLLNTSERAARLMGEPYKWSKPTEIPALPHVISLTLFCRSFLEFVLRS